MADRLTVAEGREALADITIRLILSRRSVRERYSDRTVADDVITEIVRCGLAAPSSKNARPWRLHVVTDRALLKDIADAARQADGASCYVPIEPATGRRRADWRSTVDESAAVLESVPLGIFIENMGPFSNGMATIAAVPQERLRDCLVTYTLEILGIGTALMNMWIATNAYGLQAAFIGDICVAENYIAKRLELQSDLMGVLAIGYCDDLPPTSCEAPAPIIDPARVAWHPSSVGS